MNVLFCSLSAATDYLPLNIIEHLPRWRLFVYFSPFRLFSPHFTSLLSILLLSRHLFDSFPGKLHLSYHTLQVLDLISTTSPSLPLSLFFCTSAPVLPRLCRPSINPRIYIPSNILVPNLASCVLLIDLSHIRFRLVLDVRHV